MGLFHSTPESLYTWRPDMPDMKDIPASFPGVEVRSKADLRHRDNTAFDRRLTPETELSSGTVNAVCAAVKFYVPRFKPSRLFLEYNVRGPGLRHALEALNRHGVCEESLWPHKKEYKGYAPREHCYASACLQGTVRYKRLNQDLKTLKACISSGNPFVFGFAVYESFRDPTLWDPAQDRMPAKGKCLGGHAVLAVGYTQKRKSFIVRDSQGTKWGMKGHFLMPYAFVTSSACRDFWVIELVSEETCEETPSYADIVKRPKPKPEPRPEPEPETKTIRIPLSPRKPAERCLIRDS